MSTAGRPSDSAANDLSSALREVGFVRLAAAADADSVAAAGILANALSGRGVPYQTSVTPPGEPAERATDADLTVGIGRQAGDLTIGIDDSAARTAHAVADEHGSSDLALALAGAVAADGHPGDALATAAGDAGIERRPGIAVPTPDLVDGLAYSTLVHAPFSGDREAVEALFAEAGLEAEPTADGAGRTVASQVALSVAGDPDGTASGADHVERLLRPLAGGPFRTMGGYADVLTAVARERPGLAVVLALGELDADRALEIWREHGRRAHRGLREARTGRYDGLFVLRCEPDRPLRTVAELAAAYRSPEPVVLAVADGTAVAAGARADLGEAMRETASEFGATGGGTSGLGRASFDAEATEFVAAFKEQL
jgi:hypothetical protein